MNENLNNETMMELENENFDIINMEPEEENNSGAGVKLVLAGLAGAVAVGTIAYKKIKAKKDKTPKKKRRLRWVEVEDDAFEDSYDDQIIDGEATEIDDSEE